MFALVCELIGDFKEQRDLTTKVGSVLGLGGGSRTMNEDVTIVTDVI